MKEENRVLFGLARCCPIHKANCQQKFCPTQPKNSVKCKRSWFAAKFSNLLRQLLYPLFSSYDLLLVLVSFTNKWFKVRRWIFSSIVRGDPTQRITQATEMNNVTLLYYFQLLIFFFLLHHGKSWQD